jgi:uncharacterized protein (DUF433 family)
MVGEVDWKRVTAMPQEFIERRESGLYIIGSRIPIDRVVWEYRNGEEPIAIQLHYPTLTLDEVNGAIDFYLAHKEEVEAVMAENERAVEKFRRAHPNPPGLKETLERRYHELLARRS